MKGKNATNYWNHHSEYKVKRTAQIFLNERATLQEKVNKVNCIQSCACTSCGGECSSK